VTGLRTITFLTLLAVYVMSYMAFRMTHVEVSEQDHARYVVFPPTAKGALYHFYRPLSFADEQLTGLKPRLGPLA
jgi:hypothetical protein